jgi:hypothetical protein
VFIEGQQPAAAISAPSPVVRNVGPTPLAADDIVVPPLHAAQQGINRPGSPSQAKREIDLEDEDEDTKQKRAEGFLSPQDLAAAFNLDFRPKGRHARAQQQQQQSTAIARRPGPPKPKRKARWGRRIFMLLVLGGIGAGVYAFYTWPQFHAQVIDYSKQGLEWGKQKWAELNKPSPRTPHGSTPAPAQVINVEPSPSVPATQPVEPKKSEEAPASKPEMANQLPPPAKTEQPSATSKPDAWEQIYGKQPPQKAEPPKGDSSAPPPQVSNPKTTGTIDDVRKLYRDGIDAEGNGDFATAVKKYEKIKEFSRELWPRDLDLRLTQARRQAQ